LGLLSNHTPKRLYWLLGANPQLGFSRLHLGFFLPNVFFLKMSHGSKAKMTNMNQWNMSMINPKFLHIHGNNRKIMTSPKTQLNFLSSVLGENQYLPTLFLRLIWHHTIRYSIKICVKLPPSSRGDMLFLGITQTMNDPRARAHKSLNA
jgi:hypothetical protein